MLTKFFISSVAILLSASCLAQKINISGKVSGTVANAIGEIQFICDGHMQKLTINKDDKTFSGDIKIATPQFVEIKSGNVKPQYFYIVPSEKLVLTIDKPSLQESIVHFSNSKSRQLQEIYNTYYNALQEKNINTNSRNWQQLLFENNTPLDYAESRLKEALKKNASLVASIPNFKADILFFIKGFRNYTNIDKMSLSEIETALGDIKKSNIKKKTLTIPFFREYLTDLSNAYAARTLEKYGISIDLLKQKYISQFIAAEAISKYVSDSAVKSELFAEKLRIELATNGLKNETFVDYLLNNSQQYVKDSYKEKILLLKENKIPDLNQARKKAFNFLLHDAEGKEYRLEDFKGKMLFIDFWASWCAPCKAQIPYQKELEKHYEGKDVIFVSVSLDQSKEAWLKAVKEEELHGYVLHAEGNFKNPFPKAYGVEAIPRYMLIDASGNIISDNMMKPQNKKEIMGIFDEELYAKNTQTILDKHFQAIGAETLKNNGLLTEYTQTVVSFKSKGKLYYSYPDKMKSISKMEETEQMLMMLGKDLFTEKYTVVNGEKVTTNTPGQANLKDNWINKIFGFELFLRKSVNNAMIKFAEENATTTDSCFVLKLVNNGNVEKYYINKTTYYLDKRVVMTTNAAPRDGGGFMEAITSYSDYRNINGVMIPFKINQNNIVMMKTEKAEIKPIEKNVFDN